MLRKLIIIIAAASALGAQTTPNQTTPNQSAPKKASAPDPAAATKPQIDKPQIDKVKLEAYLRHLFVWPPPIEISIGDPQPGPMAGFYEVKIRGSQGNS